MGVNFSSLVITTTKVYSLLCIQFLQYNSNILGQLYQNLGSCVMFINTLYTILLFYLVIKKNYK